MEEHGISGFNLGESEEAKVEVEDTENLAHDEGETKAEDVEETEIMEPTNM